MLDLIRLYLPVLFPSWRFFGEIGASPRVEYLDRTGQWQDATARPERVTAARLVAGLFWNADWNEKLFLVSYAERMLVEPDLRLMTELAARVARRHGLPAEPELRLVLVTSEGRQVAFQGGRNVP